MRLLVGHWARVFAWFFDLVILANAVFIATGLNQAEVVLLPLFNAEMLLKIYTHGTVNFFRNAWNRFDFTVIAAGTILVIVGAAGKANEAKWAGLCTPGSHVLGLGVPWRPPFAPRPRPRCGGVPCFLLAGTNDVDVLDVVLVLRVLRLVRVLTRLERCVPPMRSVANTPVAPTWATGGARFYVVLDTIAQLGPAILTYGSVLLAVYYVFAIVGMELFGGLVYEVSRQAATAAGSTLPADIAGGLLVRYLAGQLFLARTSV
jgi:two pore calcium channel protein 3